MDGLGERAGERGVSRRSLLIGAGGLGAGIAAGRLAAGGDGGDGSSSSAVPFFGRYQAGIATPAQASLNFAAYDFTATGAGDLNQLLRSWSEAAAKLTAGAPISPALDRPSPLGTDTGEATELGPSRLTVTIGLGPGLFERGGKDRLGLAGRRPRALAPLPPLRGDELEPALSGGDLCVQACSDDPQVAFHAVHTLTQLARGAAVPRWSQLGFGRTSSTTRSQSTPRNLMGFKDGTNNIRAEDEQAMRQHVWVQPGDGPAWMNGGTYLVARRIRMLLDVWDSTPVSEQERVFGRHKQSGAPLGGRHEFDPVNLSASAGGEPVVPTDAHIRLSSPSANAGERLLRRGYSFSDGVDRATGQVDAGLFFICFQRDPARQFVPIQQRLGADDALSRHISHVGSALFAIPPGARRSGYVGESLFA